MLKQFKQDHYPFIHFEIHGNTNGLVLNSSYVVSWEELSSHLRRINIATKNNLFISMATCYGANIFKAIDLTKKAPFFGFIATWEEIKNRVVEETFEEFFNELLYSLKTDNNTADFNISLASLPAKMSFIYSEMIFERAWDAYLEGMRDKNKYMKRLRNLVAQAISDRGIRNSYTLPEIYSVLHSNLKNVEYQKRFLRHTFLNF